MKQKAVHSNWKPWQHTYVLPPDVFILPNGHCSGLQQPVHEPAGPSRAPWRHESSQHGIRHEQPQHERASHGHEPGSNPRHGTVWSSQPKDASARVSWRTPTRHTHAGDKEAISRRGEWRGPGFMLTCRCNASNRGNYYLVSPQARADVSYVCTVFSGFCTNTSKLPFHWYSFLPCSPLNMSLPYSSSQVMGVNNMGRTVSSHHSRGSIHHQTPPDRCHRPATLVRGCQGSRAKDSTPLACPWASTIRSVVSCHSSICTKHNPIYGLCALELHWIF